MIRAAAIALSIAVAGGATGAIAAQAAPLKSDSFRVGSKIGCAFLTENEPVLRCDALFLNDTGFLLRGVDPGERIKITDTVYTPSAPRLRSGRSWVRGPFRCTAKGTTKVTCRDTGTRHGFSISRASQRVF